jgi:hypothetical protein
MSAVGMYKLLRDLEPVRVEICRHSIYENLKSLEDICIFMEHHVFAVWDFMSLLKSLQAELTCVKVPWVPVSSPRIRRLINEIVLSEETDEIDGHPNSHFELYHNAMTEIGADTRAIDATVTAVRCGTAIEVALRKSDAPAGARAFVAKTFEIISSAKPHMIAAAFTFGREEPIPNMFRTLVDALVRQEKNKVRSLVTYLDRHIGLDEDHHTPMAVEMLAELCGDDSVRWEEAAQAATTALSARLSLWNTAAGEISLARMAVPQRQSA